MSTTPSTTQFGRRLSLAAALALIAFTLHSSGCNGSSSSDAQSQTTGTPSNANDANSMSENVTAATPIGPPQITFESISHDFGTMSETDAVSTTFNFTNTGGSMLTIEEVKPACTCTVVTVSRQNFTPGQSGQMHVEFKPTSPGDAKKLIYVATNDALQPRVTLTVEADVETFIAIEPPHLNLGTLMLGSERSSYISILSPDPEMTVRSVTATAPGIDVRIVQQNTAASSAPTTGMPGQAMIEVTITDKAPWGPLFGWVEVNIDGTPPGKSARQSYTRQFRVNASIFGDLMAEPEAFRAGAKPNESFSRTVRLTRLSGQKFRIVEARIENPSLPIMLKHQTVQLNRVSDSAYDLVLNAAAGDQTGSFTAEVNIFTDVPGEENIKIQISGRVTGPAG